MKNCLKKKNRYFFLEILNFTKIGPRGNIGLTGGGSGGGMELKELGERGGVGNARDLYTGIIDGAIDNPTLHGS